MKKIWGVFLMAAWLTACSSGPKENLTVEIKGWGDEMLFVQYNTFSGEAEYEVVNTENGSFTYVLTEDEPVLFSFINGNDLIQDGGYPYFLEAKVARFILTPGSRLQLKGEDLGDRLNYELEGSALSEELTELHRELLPLLIKRDEVEKEIIATASGLEAEEQFFLYQKRFDAEQAITDAELAFALRNMSKEVAAYILVNQPQDTLKKYESTLTTAVRNGIFAPVIERALNATPPVIDVEVNM